MKLSSTLERCLADLEARIDEAQEQQIRQAWIDFLDDRVTEGFFSPPRRRPVPPKFNWPHVPINDAQDDFEMMALHQFRTASDAMEKGNGCPLSVRCNYGVAIMASQFGCEMVTMAREQNDLPTCRSIPLEQIRSAVERGVPDVRAGLGAKVFDMAERYLEIFRRWPRLSRWVTLYHPDAQGPIDTAELVWGSEMFYAFYDNADLLRESLSLLTEQYVKFMRAWFALVPQDGPHAVHWGLMHRGRLMLRDDSLMNLSPQTYVEFVRPLDQRLLDEFGGGVIHFCGRADHYIAEMSKMRGLTAAHLSQPHLNDMEVVYRNTVDKGIKLLGLDRKAAEAAEAAGRSLRGQVHCP